MNFHRFFKQLAAGVLCAAAMSGQQAPADSSNPKKAEAYYNYSMGHLYAELASAYGNRGEHLNKAIEFYRAAIKADPDASFIAEELAELFIASGQLRNAVTEAEEALRKNPEDLVARRILGRIYSRMLGDGQTGRINEEMLKKAIEQYQKISEKDPQDIESLLMLGRLQKVGQNSPESEKAYKRVLEIDPDNVDANTGLAMVYADLGDTKQASELLEKAARKNPSLRTLTTLASNYEQMRDFKLAAETLRRALDLSPGNPDLKRAYAQNLLFGDQYEEALKQYEELVAEEPRDTQSWLRISQIYRQLRNFDKAREAGTRAREQEPNNLEIRYNDVSLLESEGKTAEAIKALTEILNATARLEYSPADRGNRLLLLERLGMMYRQNHQPKEAVDTFEQMAVLDPEMGARISAQVIETWRLAKNYDNAKAEAEKSKSRYPKDRTLTLVRSNLLAEMGRVPEAATEVKSLLDGKNDRETYINLAQIYEKSKDYPQMSEAIDAAEKLSSTDEEKEHLFFMRGAMLERMKKFDESEVEFRKVLKINPDNSSALNYLGYMLADRNVRLEEARAMIQKAVDQDPQNGAYLDSLGWVYFRLGRDEDAERVLLQAAERVPKDPTVHDHLGDVYAKRGKLKEAISQWERSLTEWNATASAERDEAEIAKVQKKLDQGKVRLAKETSRN